MGSQRVGYHWATSLHFHFVSKVIFLLFNMLSRFIIAFLPRSKCLLISWLQSSSTVIWEDKTVNSATVCIFSHLFAMKWWDQIPRSKFFECWVLSQLFHSPLSLSSRDSGFFNFCFYFLPLGWCHLHIWDYWYFFWQSWFQLVLHPAQHLQKLSPLSQKQKPFQWFHYAYQKKKKKNNR